jgi:hypothetical protein
MKNLVLLSIFIVSIFANINAQASSQEENYFHQPEEDFVNQNHVIADSTRLSESTVPGKIKLWTPGNLEMDHKLHISLAWHADTLADSYSFQISITSDFSDIVIDTIVSEVIDTVNKAARCIVDLEYSTRYYWRVAGINSIGQGEWSEIWTFTTKKPVGVNDQIDQNIKIAPNPFIDQIQVSGKFEKIILCDIYGNISYEKEYPTSVDRKISINSLKLAQGIYFIIIDGTATKLLKTN